MVTALTFNLSAAVTSLQPRSAARQGRDFVHGERGMARSKETESET